MDDELKKVDFHNFAPVNPNYKVFHNSTTCAVNSQKLQKNGSQANKIDYNYELFFSESTGLTKVGTEGIVLVKNASNESKIGPKKWQKSLKMLF
jgi:hypothetical protein